VRFRQPLGDMASRVGDILSPAGRYLAGGLGLHVSGTAALGPTAPGDGARGRAIRQARENLPTCGHCITAPTLSPHAASMVNLALPTAALSEDELPPTRLELLKLAPRGRARGNRCKRQACPQSTAPSRVSGNDATQQRGSVPASSAARTGTDCPPSGCMCRRGSSRLDVDVGRP
jgi:hypothetical protein